MKKKKKKMNKQDKVAIMERWRHIVYCFLSGEPIKPEGKNG